MIIYPTNMFQHFLVVGGRVLCSQSGGLHIHTGLSCSSAALVGAHYWNASSNADPWNAPSAVWQADTRGDAVGDFEVSNLGLSIAALQNHAVVAHDSSNVRIGCGLLNADDATMSGGLTTADVIGSLVQFTTFTTLLTSSDFLPLLQSSTLRVTLFAPTDAAFLALGNATETALRGNPETLAAVLAYHIYTGGALTSFALSRGNNFTMYSGSTLRTEQSAANQPNSFNVITGDNQDVFVDWGTRAPAANGVVFAVDTLLLPGELDTLNPRNGPNGRSCGPGLPIDGSPFDGSFSCNCDGTAFHGPNCDQMSTPPPTVANSSEFNPCLDPSAYIPTQLWAPGLTYTCADVMAYELQSAIPPQMQCDSYVRTLTFEDLLSAAAQRGCCGTPSFGCSGTFTWYSCDDCNCNPTPVAVPSVCGQVDIPGRNSTYGFLWSTSGNQNGLAMASTIAGCLALRMELQSGAPQVPVPGYPETSILFDADSQGCLNSAETLVGSIDLTASQLRCAAQTIGCGATCPFTNPDTALNPCSRCNLESAGVAFSVAPGCNAEACGYCNSSIGIFDPGCWNALEYCAAIGFDENDMNDASWSNAIQCPFSGQSAMEPGSACDLCDFSILPLPTSCLQVACRYCHNSADPGCAPLNVTHACSWFPLSRPLSDEAIAAVVQPVADEAAIMLNTSFSFGYADGVDPSLTVSLAAGTNDRCLGAAPDACTVTPMENNTWVPCGSVTKAITGLAIMREIDAGRLNFSTPAHIFVDAALQRLGEPLPSMAAIWNTTAVNAITIRDLLAMTSGIMDYDDNRMWAWTVTHANRDVSPYMFLAAVNKTLGGAPPGAPAYYSGINFVLLGYVMVGLNNFTRWEEYDQRTAIPPALRDEYDDGWMFALNGKCSSYGQRMAHQYSCMFDQGSDFSLINSDTSGTLVEFDLWNYSCLNGWTMGNVATTGKNLAMMFRDIYGGLTKRKVLEPQTVRQMKIFNPLTNDWCEGCGYGLSAFAFYDELITVRLNGQGLVRKLHAYGHAGQDWGSGAQLCMYVASGFDFGLCVPMNSYGSMNSTNGANMIDEGSWTAALKMVAAIMPLFNATMLSPSTDFNLASPVYNYAWEPEFPVCSICDYNDLCAGWRNCLNNSAGECAKFHATGPQALSASCIATCSSAACRPTATQISAAVQPVLDAVSARFNVSFSFGYADGMDPRPSAVVGLAAGTDNRCLSGAPGDCSVSQLDASTRIPAGSLTKAITGVAVMREIDEGHLNFSTLAHVYIDRALQAEGRNITFADLWQNESVNRATIRDLLGMTSGIKTYDDSRLNAWTTANPGGVLEPWDYLLACDKDLTGTPPNAPAYYSSVGYILLGYVMVGLNNLSSWQEYDQMSVIPVKNRVDYAEDWLFPTNPDLRCADYPRMAHQYQSTWQQGYRDPLAFQYCNSLNCTEWATGDLYNNSCINGWTMGNVATTGKAMAMYFRDLYSSQLPSRSLLSVTTVRQMNTFKNLTNEWCPRCGYGLASMRNAFSFATFGEQLPPPSARTMRGRDVLLDVYGHQGQDWGSGAPVCGYVGSGFEFGMCLVQTTETGLSLSDRDSDSLMLQFQAAGQAAAMEVLGAVLQTLNASRTSPVNVGYGPINYTLHFAYEYPQCLICNGVEWNNICRAPARGSRWSDCLTTSAGDCEVFYLPPSHGTFRGWCLEKCPRCSNGSQANTAGTRTAVSAIEFVRNNPALSTVAELLTSTVASALEGPNLTFFAPTNEAIAALPNRTLEYLSDNSSALTAVLSYHICAMHQLKSFLENKTMTMGIHRNLSVGMATVVVYPGPDGSNGLARIGPPEGDLADIIQLTNVMVASNGAVVQLINSVMFPPGFVVPSHYIPNPSVHQITLYYYVWSRSPFLEPEGTPNPTCNPNEAAITIAGTAVADVCIPINYTVINASGSIVTCIYSTFYAYNATEGMVSQLGYAGNADCRGTPTVIDVIPLTACMSPAPWDACPDVETSRGYNSSETFVFYSEPQQYFSQTDIATEVLNRSGCVIAGVNLTMYAWNDNTPGVAPGNSNSACSSQGAPPNLIVSIAVGVCVPFRSDIVGSNMIHVVNGTVVVDELYANVSDCSGTPDKTTVSVIGQCNTISSNVSSEFDQNTVSETYVYMSSPVPLRYSTPETGQICISSGCTLVPGWMIASSTQRHSTGVPESSTATTSSRQSISPAIMPTVMPTIGLPVTQSPVPLSPTTATLTTLAPITTAPAENATVPTTIAPTTVTLTTMAPDMVAPSTMVPRTTAPTSEILISTSPTVSPTSQIATTTPSGPPSASPRTCLNGSPVSRVSIGWTAPQAGQLWLPGQRSGRPIQAGYVCTNAEELQCVDGTFCADQNANAVPSSNDSGEGNDGGTDGPKLIYFIIAGATVVVLFATWGISVWRRNLRKEERFRGHIGPQFDNPAFMDPDAMDLDALISGNTYQPPSPLLSTTRHQSNRAQFSSDQWDPFVDSDV